MLLNNGIYWDDWIYFHWDPNLMISHFTQFGNVYLGYFYNFMFSLPDSVFLFRLMTFLAFLLAGLLLNEVLKHYREQIDDGSRLILVLLFMLLPVNGARIALCTYLYGVCYFFFFLGLWLTVRYMATGRLYLRALALIFLFLSFFTNSFLAFYAIVLLVLAYKYVKTISVGAFYRFAVRFADFLLLPLIFWTVKSLFFVQSGLYSSYNQMTLISILYMPKNFVVFSYDILKEIYIDLTGFSLWLVLAAVVLFVITFRVIRKDNAGDDKNRQYLPLLAFGLICLALALIPYFAVGKMPIYWGWESRHQLLLPLGACFTLYYGLKIIFGRLKISSRILFVLLAIVIVFSICANVSNYLSYQKQTYKQDALIEQFKSSDLMRNYTTFLFDDHTPGLNARENTFCFYEYTGMMASAFNEQTRFGEEEKYFTNISSYMVSHTYKFIDYKEHEPERVITIDYGSYELNDVNLIKLMFEERFDREQFDEDIGNILILH